MKYQQIKKRFSDVFNEQSKEYKYPYIMTWEMGEDLLLSGIIYMNVPETHWFKKLFIKTKKLMLAIFEVEDEVYLDFLLTTTTDLIRFQIKELLLLAEAISGREVIINE